MNDDDDNDADSDSDYEDGGYDDGFSSDTSYTAKQWNPGETGALLLAGRGVQAPGEALTYTEVKAAVAAVEALGGGLTLVLSGDTTTTGPADTEPCRQELAVGVVVAAVGANDGSPTRVDRAAALRGLAARRDHAAIAAALPEPLRGPYLAARDQLLVVPVGPLPYAYLVHGVAGGGDDEGRPGTYYRGTTMGQEGHDNGVWGEKIASGEFTDVVAVELDREDAEAARYWLIGGYD